MAASIVNESDNSVTVTAGRFAVGSATGDVVLTSSTGAVAILSNGFQYGVEGNVTSVSPSSGQYGMRVRLRGTALQG